MNNILYNGSLSTLMAPLQEVRCLLVRVFSIWELVCYKYNKLNPYSIHNQDESRPKISLKLATIDYEFNIVRAMMAFRLH